MLHAGEPFKNQIRSSESIVPIEPTIGLDQSKPGTSILPGAAPVADNLIVRDGALELRPTLSLHTSTPQSWVGPVLGMYEMTSVTGDKQTVQSGQTTHAVYGLGTSPNDWAVLTYSPGVINDPPSLAPTEHWDYTQVYSATDDQNLLYMAPGSYQTLYATVYGSTVFSTMTGAPQAKYVAAYDNYVLAFNQKSGGANYVQRVQWNDRGSASSWTGGLSGFEDLLDMRGQGTRIIRGDNGVLLFSDEEVWRGTPANEVFVWSFAPYDITRGAPFSWTITNTPIGTMFLGKDYQVYLLPKGGGPSQPIGQRLHRKVRTTISTPEQSWAVYDNTYSQYQLYYPIANGSGTPQRAAYLDITSGAWFPQSFDSAGGKISLTAGAEGYVPSSATTWGGLQAAGRTWANLQSAGMTWANLMGSNSTRAMLAGSSKGTVFYLNSTGTNDNGIAVPTVWQSGGLLSDEPAERKTVTEFRVDYQADSASKITVQFSTDQGATFAASSLSLPAISAESQSVAFPYFGARYPAFEITSEGVRHRLMRFWLSFRRGAQ